MKPQISTSIEQSHRLLFSGVDPKDTLFGLDDWMQGMAEDTMRTELVRQETIAKETCRHCKHRQRWGFDHSEKITQHCALQPNRRNRTGLKRIKVTDKACERFEYSNQPSEDNFEDITL